MEGPASVAYQSSLRVENGQEKSIYDRPNESDVSVDDENATPILMLKSMQQKLKMSIMMHSEKI